MNEIEFSEVTTDETGTYLAIWKNDIHHSFLIEDVLEAMTNTDTTRAIEFTGGSAATLSESLDQWEAERQALAELYDENQALTISIRQMMLTMTLAEKIITSLETEAAMFITQPSRNKIEQFREQMQKLNERIAHSKMIVADAQARRHAEKE